MPDRLDEFLGAPPKDRLDEFLEARGEPDKYDTFLDPAETEMARREGAAMRASSLAGEAIDRAAKVREMTGFPSITEYNKALPGMQAEWAEKAAADKEQRLRRKAFQIAESPSGYPGLPDPFKIPGFDVASREERVKLLMQPENRMVPEALELRSRELDEKVGKAAAAGAMTALAPFNYTYQLIAQTMGGDKPSEAHDIAARQTLISILAPYAERDPELFASLRPDPSKVTTAGQAALKAMRKFGIEGSTAIGLATLGELAAQAADPLFFMESSAKLLGHQLDKKLTKELFEIYRLPDITGATGADLAEAVARGEIRVPAAKPEGAMTQREVLESRLRSGQITYEGYQAELATLPSGMPGKPPNLVTSEPVPPREPTLPLRGQQVFKAETGEFGLPGRAAQTPQELAEIEARRAAEPRMVQEVTREPSVAPEPTAPTLETPREFAEAYRKDFPDATDQEIANAYRADKAIDTYLDTPAVKPETTTPLVGHTGRPLVQKINRGMNDPVVIRFVDPDQQMLYEIGSKMKNRFGAKRTDPEPLIQQMARASGMSESDIRVLAQAEYDHIRAQANSQPKIMDPDAPHLNVTRATETTLEGVEKAIQARQTTYQDRLVTEQMNQTRKAMEAMNDDFNRGKLTSEQYAKERAALDQIWEGQATRKAASDQDKAISRTASELEAAWRGSTAGEAYREIHQSRISPSGVDPAEYEKIVPRHLRGGTISIEEVGSQAPASGSLVGQETGGLALSERLRALVKLAEKPNFRQQAIAATGAGDPAALAATHGVKDLLRDTPLINMTSANQAAIDLAGQVEPIPQIGMTRDRVAKIVREVFEGGRPDVEVAEEAIGLMRVWSAEDMMRGIDPPAPAGPGTAWRLDTMSAAVVARNDELAEQLGNALMDVVRTQPAPGAAASAEHIAALRKAYGYSQFYDQFLKLADKNLRREVGAALRQFRILEEGFSKEAADALRKATGAEGPEIRSTLDKFVDSQAQESKEWLQKWGKDLLPGGGGGVVTPDITQLYQTTVKFVTKVVDPELWYHLSVVGGEALQKGARTLANWSLYMAKQAGDVWKALTDGAKLDLWERTKSLFSKRAFKSPQEAAEALENSVLLEAQNTGIVDPEMADGWMKDRAVSRMRGRETWGEHAQVGPDGKVRLTRAHDRDARVVTANIYMDLVRRGAPIDEAVWASRMIETMGESIRPFIAELQGATKVAKRFTQDVRSKVVLDQLKREGYKFGLDSPENMGTFAKKYAAYMKNPQELQNAIFRSKRQGFLDWLSGTAVVSKLTSPALYLGNLVANEGRAVMQAVAVEAAGDIGFANRLFGGKAQMRPGEGIAYFLARWRSPASLATKDGLRDLFRAGGVRKAWSNTMRDFDRIAQGEVLGESKAADVFTPGTPSFIAPAPYDVGRKAVAKRFLSRIEAGPRWALETGDRHYFEATQYARLYEMGFREARSKGMSFGDALRYADKWVDSPAGKVFIEQAKIHAREAVFREAFGEGVVDRLLASLGSVSRVPVIGKLLLPFYRTSVNIAKQGFRFGVPFSPKNIQDLIAGGLTREEAMGRMAVGAMAAGTAYYLWSNGIVTGEGPSDMSDKRAWNTFNSKNSFRTDFGPVPIRVLGDVPARMLTPWINLFEQMAYYKMDPHSGDGLKAVNAILKDATRTNLTSTAKTVSDLLQFQGRGDDALKGVALGYLPTFLKWGAYVLDPTVREVGDLEESAAARTVGLSKGAAPRLTPLGSEQRRNRIFAAFGFDVVEKPDSTERWLGELGVSFDELSRYVDGEKVAPEDINRIKMERRHALMPFLEAMRKSADLEAMTKEERAFVIDFVANNLYPASSPARLYIRGKYSAKAVGVSDLSEEQAIMLGMAMSGQAFSTQWKLSNNKRRAELIQEAVSEAPAQP